MIFAEKHRNLAQTQSKRLADAFLRGFRPGDRLAPSEWCEKHVEEIPYSPIPGPFRASNSPMTRAVMDAIVNPRIRSVCVSACIQSGKTLAPELALAYIVANAPGPTMWLDITDESAKDQGEGRLRPLFEHCKPVKELFNPDKNKMRNRTMIFTNGMTLWVAGAKNKRNLQRRSIRWLFGDETWLWEPGRMAEAEARVAAFGYLGKCVFMSQGSFENDDTDKKFKASNQQEWCFTCPHCGNEQSFTWENLHFDSSIVDAAGKRNYAEIRKTVHLVCEHCGKRFENSDSSRRRLNAAARFVPQNLSAAPDAAGFHWNALATTDWGLLAEQFLRAKDAAKRGDISDLQAFIQKRLAKPWKDDEETYELAAVVVPEGGYKLGDPWKDEAFFNPQNGTILAPQEAAEAAATLSPLRFLTIDVQDGYFYYALRAWSKTGDSRLIDCGMLQSFSDIETLARSRNVFPAFVFLDCGFRTPSVLAFCAKNNFTAFRGDARNEWRFNDGHKRFYSPCEKISVGNSQVARRFFYSNLRVKDILAALRAGQTTSTWEIPSNAPENYVRQLGSERRNNDKQIWERIGHRANHYLDCEAMQVAAAVMLKIIGKES